MDLNKIIQSLHPLERAVLPHLRQGITPTELAVEAKLQEVEVMRTLQWFENKKLIQISEEVKEVINLDSNGMLYIMDGLPEKRFLECLTEERDMDDVQRHANLDKNELNICIGLLKKKSAISIHGNQVQITSEGKALLSMESMEEDFMKRLPKDVSKLMPDEKKVYDDLKQRKKIIKTEIIRLKKVELTELGRAVSKLKLNTEYVENLTPRMLKDGSWKNKTFRRYDVSINVPRTYAAKKQHYRRFLDIVRQKFIALGFTEMFGPIVETNFWNMDALFMPQFHSARDIHDAYYIKEPKYSKMDKRFVDNVREAHENGFKTGSKGWQYKFDAKLTQMNLLRTQGTALSARTLASKGLKIPGKYFAIARCFRRDVVDATHLADFNQVEGFVVEEGLTLRHLIGLLKIIAHEIAGAKEIKIMPGYFPFTEPSAALYAKHPDIGWIELGGSGIFRPEVVKPLGVDTTVIAWGIGVDRLAMTSMGIKDIRELFSQDLNFLRNSRVI